MAKARRGRSATRNAPARPLGALAGPPEVAEDPLTGLAAEIRRVEPYAARKSYRCPGCNQDVAIGVGHVVVVPLGDAESRRHWHRGCWQHRHRRPLR